KRELIIVSGFNVFPSEVEAALLKDPRVSEAAVVGVPHAYTGEGVKAYVVLKDGAEATAEEIADMCKGYLARFKCPETVEIVDEFPHLENGKVLKRVLHDRSGSGRHT
ncbi:MAG: long-chain fatty acid--CoA ligase, partial [Actinobacteria bacterium]|nr:long-chain fatty acid--CoA ligase [Actinomycetota bacterium]